MRYVLLLALLSLLLVAACGNGSSEDAAQATVPVNETGINESVACPVCEECPAAPEPEPCPAPECAVTGDRVELSLNNVELVKHERGADEDVTVVKLVDKEFDTMETALLTFRPLCGNPGTLRIRLEDEKLYDQEPPCGELVRLPIPLAAFAYGRSTFTFTTRGDEDYAIEDIALHLTFLNGSNTTKELYPVRFTPNETAEQLVEKLPDVKLANYEEYELELTSEEATEDLTLRFDGDTRDGALIILVNEERLSAAQVQRHLNELTIPAVHLREGTNYLTFIGVSG